ncbi:hypothetical protein IJO12_03160 [bacterium]|nr:hypothetical protein [bacterium]
MGNNFSDIFEVKKVHATSNEINSDSNFFLNDALDNYNFSILAQSDVAKHLNDYDFNLLKEGAYKDIDNNMLKLEYKITRTENELKNINSQLQAAEAINDNKLIESILDRKAVLEEDYKILLEMYNKKNISAKFSDSILNFFGNIFKINNSGNFLHAFIEKYSNKMPRQFVSLVELKKSLDKLENINKSVDELIAMNIPYGENNDKYRQLSSYIIKANSIQSEIVKNMKK